MGKIKRNDGVQISGGQINAEVFAVGKDAIALKVSDSFAKALKDAHDGILASTHLPEAEKRQQLEVIKEIGQEIEKKEPRKSIVKKFTQGLVASLQAAPDLTKNVLELTQLLSKF